MRGFRTLPFLPDAINPVVPEIRQDPTTREWVIIATERAKRPHEFASLPHRSGQASRSSCVFCPGNEKGQAFTRQKPGNRSRTLHHLASDATATLRAPLSTKTLGLGKES